MGFPAGWFTKMAICNRERQLDYLKEYKTRPHVKAKRAADAKRERLTDPTRIKQNITNYKIRLHTEILQAYGMICACCGEANGMFLTLDHINNDGAAHRKSINCKGMGGTKFYAWVKRNNFPDYLQLLCWNCNCGKHRNGGTCPHSDGQHPDSPVDTFRWEILPPTDPLIGFKLRMC